VAVSIRLERRGSLPLAQRVLVLSVAVVLGGLASGFLVQATGYSALKAMLAIVDGSFGGSYPISQTLAAAIPLATIALGTAVAFRVQLWNIGGEGQFYMGA
jgi:general nucleoside transport system permease protein